MAITFVAAGAIPTSNTSIALVAPACQSGDTLLAAIGNYSGGAITAPSGWTLVGTNGPAPSAVWYVKTATSGDSSATFTFSSASNLSGTILAYRGATGVGGSASAVGSGGTVTTPSVTTTAPNQLVLEVFTSKGPSSGGVTIAAPATVRAVSPMFSGPGNIGIAVSEQTQATAGATPTQTATTGKSTEMAATVLTLKGNTAPNAPIPTSPANNATVNRANPIPLAATFSDADPGDSPSASQWRYRIRDIGAAWSTVTQNNTLQSYSIPAGLTAGAYEWQAAYADQQGLWGPFCSSAFFTAGDPPPGPVWLDPISGQTISVSTYTGVISQASLTESSWTLYADNAGTMSSTILQGPVSVTTGDLRRHTFTGLANNTPVWWSVTTKDAGLWSPVTSERTPVSYTVGPAPVVTTTPVPTEGALDITIVNPAPGGGEPAAAYNNVWIDDRDGKGWVRKATLLATNTTWRYWSPRSGVDTLVKVETTATNGTTSEGFAA